MRVDVDLVDAAKSVGALESRSATQQLSHWARIGRELETSPGTNHRDIQRVLAGEAGYEYDDLEERDQAVVRASWNEQIEKRRASLNFAEEFTRAGRSWTEADAQGRVVKHGSVAEAALKAEPKATGAAKATRGSRQKSASGTIRVVKASAASRALRNASASKVTIVVKDAGAPTSARARSNS